MFVAGKKKKKETLKERVSVRRLRKLVKREGRESWFTSFVTFPRRVCFDIQEEGEAVVLFLRQHPIVNLGWVGGVMGLSVLPLFFYIFPAYQMLTPGLKVVVVLGWYLGVAGFALAKFLGWYFNIFILTDERMIDVDFLNLFSRVISEAKLDKIQDVNSVMSGVWQTFFNYGSVFVQTASEVAEFVFENIPYPDAVVKIINKLIDVEEEERLEGRVK